MKTKKLILPAIMLVGLFIAYAIVSVVFCYNTKPRFVRGNFPFPSPMNIWVKPKRFQVFMFVNTMVLKPFSQSTTGIGMGKWSIPRETT